MRTILLSLLKKIIFFFLALSYFGDQQRSRDSEYNKKMLPQNDESSKICSEGDVCTSNAMAALEHLPLEKSFFDQTKLYLSKESIIVHNTLEEKLSKKRIILYKNKVFSILWSLYNASEDNKRHFDYPLFFGLKFLLIPENPQNPSHYQYRGAENTIHIPIPYEQGKITFHLYDDPFEICLSIRIFHELQHAHIALMNSDKNCRPDIQNQQYLAGASKEIPVSLPRDPDEILRLFKMGGDYIVNHVQKILPNTGFIDYTKKYTLEESAPFFKGKNRPNTIEAEKELAYLQHLLKDYHGRQSNYLVHSSRLDEVVKSLNEQKAWFVPSKTVKEYPLYIVSVEERHGAFYGTGYMVENPEDKVRALVEDIKYIQSVMPNRYQFYQRKDLNYPRHSEASEFDAHSYEIGLKAHKEIFSELEQYHEETQRKSVCNI